MKRHESTMNRQIRKPGGQRRRLHFRLPRCTTKPKRPSSPRKGGADIKASWRRTKPRKEIALKKHSASLLQNLPARSGVDGAILSRKEKPTRSGQSSREPNPAPTRLLRRGKAVGGLHWSRCTACSLPASSPQRAEPALPRGGARPVLTLAAEPEVVRGGGLHRPAVVLLFLPLSLHAPDGGGGVRRSRRPAPFRPRARPAPSVRPSVGGPRPLVLRRRARRAQAQRPELAPPSPLAPAAPSPRAEPRSGPRGGWGRWRRREDGRQAADPYGQREAQQEHHPARQRRQDLEKCPRRKGLCRTLVIGSLHFCCLWLCNFPDYSKYQDGHVK